MVKLRKKLGPRAYANVVRLPTPEGCGPTMAELSERPMTPLPYQKIAVLVMVFLGDSLCMSVVLPFVPFMVKTYLGLPPDQDYLTTTARRRRGGTPSSAT